MYLLVYDVLSRRLRNVPKLTGHPLARAAVGHHERLESFDVGIEVGVLSFCCRPIHPRLLPRRASCSAIGELRRLYQCIQRRRESFCIVHFASLRRGDKHPPNLPEARVLGLLRAQHSSRKASALCIMHVDEVGEISGASVHPRDRSSRSDDRKQMLSRDLVKRLAYQNYANWFLTLESCTSKWLL
jgi:hypothetical protein